jgi:predicted nucleic acid-binding protein
VGFLGAAIYPAILDGPARVTQLPEQGGRFIGQVGRSAISLGELSFGAARSPRRDQAFEALAQFVLALEVVVD